MGKNKKVMEATRKSARLPIKKLTAAKKQPKHKLRRSATATARPGSYDFGPDSDSSDTEDPCTSTGGSSTSGTSGATPSSEKAAADEEDDWVFKHVMKKRKIWPPLPKRPKPRMDEEDMLVCHGLNDFQLNGYMSKTGFKDVIKGYACVKGNTCVLKSGYFRLLLTRDFKHYAIPSSMTTTDWARMNKFRQWDMDIFIFLTREYCVKSFVTKRRGNAGIPTDDEIVDNYSYQAVKDKEGNTIGWEFQPSHTTLLHIRGTTVTLYDVNNNDLVDWEDPANSFVDDFYDIVSRRVLPRLCKNFGLNLADIRKKYSVYYCYYPHAVSYSCALFLLFVIEQTVDNMRNVDVNWSPSLSQLFFHKVVHHVAGGGDMDYGTFVSNNPDWLTIVRPFIFEQLLTDLKLGDRMKGGLPALRSTMKKISNDVEYKVEWYLNRK